MEVQKVSRASLNRVAKKDDAPMESVSFTEVMHKKKDDVLFERFQAMAQQIEAQGKKLAESQTVEDLKTYKKLVKQFLDDAVKNSLQLEEQRGFSRGGRSKIYKLVKEVDQKLVDLTNAVLEKEKKGLDLLGLVGEIQGLIINIYT
ncbi:YaaR family protein [Anoxybacillus flavithermus]|uniref:YaaR family protein n=1 Tax=Anoxybacillus TaxID=150247 RepID=UPI001866F293|nr:YaaR family protein [Anoxybacillus flavithermus]MBE2912926.1 YaaR family protein [Anoxybacillus flavithermus]